MRAQEHDFSVDPDSSGNREIVSMGAREYENSGNWPSRALGAKRHGVEICSTRDPMERGSSET